MGANRLETVFNVTLPIIAPSVLTAVLIAFVVSFGEFTATQFLTSPDTTTVPVIIYTMTRTGLSPEISALATLLVGVMLVAAVAAEYFGEGA
jgi:ABC-type spermidine/putrescine transport system permease subunit II